MKNAWRLGVLLLAASCGHEIGDGCTTSIDCSQTSERSCDISQPGGYCTVDGCDERSCPGEAECIRIFPYLTTTCGPDQSCATEELCLAEGRCAPRASERRYCAKRCGGNGDCRGGYECRLAGTDGSEALLKVPTKVIRFCAPTRKPQ